MNGLRDGELEEEAVDVVEEEELLEMGGKGFIEPAHKKALSR